MIALRTLINQCEERFSLSLVAVAQLSNNGAFPDLVGHICARLPCHKIDKFRCHEINAVWNSTSSNRLGNRDTTELELRVPSVRERKKKNLRTTQAFFFEVRPFNFFVSIMSLGVYFF